MTDKLVFRFPHVVQIPLDSPDASHLPSTHDADPGISAEIAVERGEATPEQEAYIEHLETDDHPVEVEIGEEIEVEVELTPERLAALEAGRPVAVAYPAENGTLFANEDRTTHALREGEAPDQPEVPND